MNFNFSSYLSGLDPSSTYHVDRLTGGVVNVTVRATKSSLPLSSETRSSPSNVDLNGGQGRFPGHKTLILKHAPPFIAGVGESAPISQTRQVRDSS